MNQEVKNRVFSVLKVMFTTALFVSIAITSYRELFGISFKDTLAEFSKISHMSLVLLLIGGGVSLVILSVYDVILSRALKMDIFLGRVLRASYVINALNAVVGFGGFIGAGVRAMVYKNYMHDKKKLVHFISLILISMLTGLSLLSLLIVFHIFDTSLILDRITWVRWVLCTVSFFLSLFVIYSMVRPPDKNNRSVRLYCTLVSCVEWLAAVVILYFCGVIVDAHVSFMSFIAIFIIATSSGLVSFIPDGFGAFGLVVLLGFEALGVPEGKVLLMLLLYRFAYYFVPVTITLILSSFESGTSAKKYVKGSEYFIPAKDVTSFLMSYQRNTIARIPSLSLAVLVFLISIIFFVDNLTVVYDALYDGNRLTYYILLAIHINARLLLLLNVVGIYEQSRCAIIFTMISILLIAVATFFTYISYILIARLAIISVLLIVAFRRAHRLKRPVRMRNIVAMFLLSLFILYVNHIFVAETLCTLGICTTEMHTSVLRYYFRLTILIIAVTIGVIARLSDCQFSKVRISSKVESCEEIINQYDGNYLSHLIYSGDKQFLTSENKIAFLVYRYKVNSLVVLEDPLGDENVFDGLLRAFHNYAEYLGYDVIFYQITDQHIPLYHNLGDQFFRLGEEAIIDLTQFSTSGKRRRGFRVTLNEFDGLNISFGIIEPPFSTEFINELQYVNDLWLDNRQEMHFSVGEFNGEYLSKTSIGVMRNEENEIIVFYSLMPTYFNDAISVDLTRWLPELDLPLMDDLYLHMLLWSRGQGYTKFNVGMATLSNVGQLHYSYLKERLTGCAFEHFNGLYCFQGLRRYKSRYSSNWEPRFLVCRKDNSLWGSLSKVIRVMHHE